LMISDEYYLQAGQLDSENYEGNKKFITFSFQMPILRAGIYSIDGMVASNPEREEHSQHWLHDGYLVQSLSKSLSTGLIGLPMISIKLVGLDQEETR